jgi:hypothetical protein
MSGNNPTMTNSVVPIANAANARAKTAAGMMNSSMKSFSFDSVGEGRVGGPNSFSAR